MSGLTKEVVPGVHTVPLGFVNAFILETGDGVTLIDTGTPGSGTRIVAAVEQLGYRARDVRAVLVTHAHADHTGGLQVVKTLTGAEAYMQVADARLVERGQAMRPMVPGPGLTGRVAARLAAHRTARVPPAKVEHLVEDGDELPFAGGLKAIHLPGHCAGQLAFLRSSDGVLFAADAAARLLGRLRLAIIYEDLEQGRRDAARLAGLDFEVACFGHGAAITAGASRAFRRSWGGRG